MDYTIDATGRSMGRVASEAAKVLMGKHRADYTPHNPPMTKVVIENANAMSIPVKRMLSTTYERFSGYPSGRKVQTLEEVMEKKGIAEAMRLSVQRMLPNNKLRAPRMKNLTIK